MKNQFNQNTIGRKGVTVHLSVYDMPFFWEHELSFVRKGPNFGRRRQQTEYNQHKHGHEIRICVNLTGCPATSRGSDSDIPLQSRIKSKLCKPS